MSQALQRNIGSHVKVLNAVPPQDAAAGAINGTGIDRTPYESAVLHLAVKDASGTPSAQSVPAKVQHSDDDSTYVDVTGATIAALTTDNAQASLKINLAGYKKFVRAVVTPAFTGGTTPKIEVVATWVFGGPTVIPTT